jgi:hypothetical protein
VVETAGLGSKASIAYGCLDASTPLAVVTADGRFALVAGDGGKVRKVRSDNASDLTYAAPIDVDGDGSDEVALVITRSSPSEIAVRIEIHRLEAGRLQRVGTSDAYVVSDKSARWAGAQLSQIDLLIQLKASENTVVAGGLYVQRSRKAVRVVAPLAERGFSVRARGQSEPATPAVAIDAGPPPDTSGVRRKPQRTDAGPGPVPKRPDKAVPR